MHLKKKKKKKKLECPLILINTHLIRVFKIKQKKTAKYFVIIFRTLFLCMLFSFYRNLILPNKLPN